jgi:hypothetical protein
MNSGLNPRDIAKRSIEIATFYQYAVTEEIYRLLFASRGDSHELAGDFGGLLQNLPHCTE